MPRHVSEASIYRPDPAAPNKRWIGTPLAEADQVAVLDAQPEVAQPFRFAGGSVLGDFVVNQRYWLTGTDSEEGRRVWLLRLRAARAGGTDVVLEADVIA